MRHLVISWLLALSATVSMATASIAGAQTAGTQTNAQQRVLTNSMRFMQYHETQSNAIAQRSAAPFVIEHFEIPLDLLESQMDLRMDPKISQALVFEKDGRRYLRWLINPEDSKWHLEVEKFLSANGVSIERKTHFTGYQTASRSYIVKDPVNGAEFSAKVSTDRSGGMWTDKKQTWEDASQVRLAYEYINDIVRKRGGLKNAILIDEPAAFGIKSIDQGMLIRTYDSLNDGQTKLIPGFSVLHEQRGTDIARANGIEDPERFWNEHYNKPLARALAEVYALTGITYDSPHSQNFLVELDSFNRPTGRIALRDLGDAYLAKEVFEAAGRPDILAKWEQPLVLKGQMNVGVGLLHGNADPSWLTTGSLVDVEYRAWGIEFYKEFEKEFHRITGVAMRPASSWTNKKYFGASYSLTDEAGEKYLDWVRGGRGSANRFVPRTCNALFRKAM